MSGHIKLAIAESQNRNGIVALFGISPVGKWEDILKVIREAYALEEVELFGAMDDHTGYYLSFYGFPQTFKSENDAGYFLQEVSNFLQNNPDLWRGFTSSIWNGERLCLQSEDYSPSTFSM